MSPSTTAATSNPNTDSSAAAHAPSAPLEAAELRLDSFALPPTLSSHASLHSLTLTSDIPLSSYASLLESSTGTGAFSVPPLPASVRALTLELFTMGYPAGFLGALGRALPNLAALTLYSQLVAGTTAESFADAVQFFAALARRRRLSELRLLDVFVPADFWGAVAAAGEAAARDERREKKKEERREGVVEAAGGGNGEGVNKNEEEEEEGEKEGKTADEQKKPGLKVLEVSYTFRASDPHFNTSLPLAQLAHLVTPGLVSLTISIRPQDASTDTPNTTSSSSSPGMTPCAFGIGAPIVERLLAWPEEDASALKALDLSAVEMEVDVAAQLLRRVKNVVVCTLALKLGGRSEEKRTLLESVKEMEQLERLEIVGAPGVEFFAAMSSDKIATLNTAFINKEDAENLSSARSSLKEVEVSMFKVPELGYSRYRRDDDDGGQWVGETSYGVELTEKERARIAELEHESAERVVEQS